MNKKNNKSSLACPLCTSHSIRKFGLRKNRFHSIQRYLCNSCKHAFTINSAKNKSYPINIILDAISKYNSGLSQSEVSAFMQKKCALIIPQKTISNWITDNKSVCTFAKIRTACMKLSNNQSMIESHSFLHNNLPYKFMFHIQKLSLLTHSSDYNNKFSNHLKFYNPLQEYLTQVSSKNFPHHIFGVHQKIIQNTKERASEIKFQIPNFVKISKNNLANKLATLALNLAKDHKSRHQIIQDFMLTNDSSTIATEVPVYLTHDDINYFRSKNFTIPLNQEQKTPITGHIDFIQIRNNSIHILDYKPDAHKVNPITQLTIYALALASRTKLAVRDFTCAWFDENNYYEFYPLHIVYPRRNKK